MSAMTSFSVATDAPLDTAEQLETQLRHIGATRYHSLVVQPDTLSDEFEVTAWAEEPGGYREIMGIAHREYPLFGVQFHPESFLTHAGYDILRAFLAA